MKTSHKLVLGALAGAGVLWGTRALLRKMRWMDLRDRVVLITGADSGFGLILAKQIAGQGASLVLAARKADRLEAAAEEVRGAGASEVLVVPTDISVESQANDLIAKALEHFGRIDVLINNAGQILVGAQPTLSLDDYRDLMATNFWGAVYTSHAALPFMRERGEGRIANVGSVGGRFAIPHMLPYVASKYALTGYTKALRAEAARAGVLVTGIYPATIRTGGHTHAWFKGDADAEYRWFALSDSIPGIATSAEIAAEKAIFAIQAGDPEVIIGLAGKLNVAFEGLFPDWSAELVALIEKAMPAPANVGQPAVQGEELHGRFAEFVNRMVPQIARAT